MQETTNEIVFTEEYRDETTIHRYRVIRLWEQDSALFLNNRGLLPLAPLTKTDSPTALLNQVAQTVATISDIREQQNITGCLGILAGLRFDKDLIRQFLPEDIMRQSVIYQDIVQKEAFKLVRLMINGRFGEIDSSLMQQIENLSAEQLEALVKVFFSLSNITDLQAYLDRENT